MRGPDLLRTRRGRLTAFFFLYLTEGIPLGFVATAIATELRRQGIGPAEIGVFVGSFYLPWAFKWAFGPLVDVFGSDRLGRRRMWIVIAQSMMVLTLVSTVGVELPAQLKLFTFLLLIHNVFGATQDVAIDALACNVLKEHERGLANGVMFGAAYLGQTIGGSGVLFLTGYTGFKATFFFVGGCILAVTLFVALPLKEPKGPPRPPVEGSRLVAAGREMRKFALDAFRAFHGSSGAFNALFFALLPAGAMCLGLALQANLAVELGMDNDEIAWLNLWSAVISATCCVIGGLLSDRLGRKRMLAAYIALNGLPVFWLAWRLQQAGWIMPVDVQAPDRPIAPAELIAAFWIASLVYAVFHGLMYGTRTALFMDVTTPAVAATQFTAYMALLNLVISYSATWQGIAIEAWGYPKTMVADGIFGIACLAVLPLIRPEPASARGVREGASRRARGLAFALGLLALAWIPYRLVQEQAGAIQPIAGTLFTLVFVGSGVFLLASTALLGATSRLEARLALFMGLLLPTMHVRYYMTGIGSRLFGLQADTPGMDRFLALGEIWLLGIPAAGGLLLLALAARNQFTAMAPAAAEPAAAGGPGDGGAR